MIVAWKYIMLKEVENEEEAFREIRRFLDANQLPAQTVRIEEGFSTAGLYFISKRDRHRWEEEKQLFSCKQVSVETTGVYRLPSLDSIYYTHSLTFRIWHEDDRSKLQAVREFRSKEQFMRYHKTMRDCSEFELDEWRKKHELLYSMLENYLKDRAAEKEAQKCH